MLDFIGGLELSRLFYEEEVKPILSAACPNLVYAAALIGPGSEVLGYDTPLSTDHDWGPRLLLFLAERDDATLAPEIDRALQERLPSTFRGYRTRFALSHNDTPGSPHHRVAVHVARHYFAARLGCDPSAELRMADWLSAPEQILLELTAGAVYHDGYGEVSALRARLAYYPRDVWLYRMAMQWRRVAQQEAFVGRAGDVGDELGSQLIAAGIARDLMRVCFLIERRYAPYDKWFGMAFNRLSCGPSLDALLRSVLRAHDWRTREARLADAYAAVLTLHNRLGVTPPIATMVAPYYDRPYLVVHGGRVVDTLLAAIEDPAVRALPACGAIDQLSDSIDFLGHNELRGQLRSLYG